MSQSATLTAPVVTVVPPQGGEKFWIVGDQLAFKLTAEQSGGRFSFVEGLVQPQGGPPPHVHGREDEIFYVLEGSFTFIKDDATIAATAGDAVFIERGRTHTFKNTGDTVGRLMVTTTPSGFESFVAEAGYVCNDPSEPVPAIDAPAIEKLQAACAKFGLQMKFDHQAGPVAATLNAGRELWVLGAHVGVKLDSADTNGQLSMVEVTCEPGRGVPAHAHDVLDEVFYVLEGTVEFEVDGEAMTATPGTFVHVPPTVVHAFRNVGTVPAKLVDYHLPGGFEAFFDECGQPCTDRANPPAPVIPDAETLVAVLAKHGMTM